VSLEEEGLEMRRLKVDLLKFHRDMIIYAVQQTILMPMDGNSFEDKMT